MKLIAIIILATLAAAGSAQSAPVDNFHPDGKCETAAVFCPETWNATTPTTTLAVDGGHMYFSNHGCAYGFNREGDSCVVKINFVAVPFVSCHWSDVGDNHSQTMRCWYRPKE